MCFTRLKSGAKIEKVQARMLLSEVLNTKILIRSSIRAATFRNECR